MFADYFLDLVQVPEDLSARLEALMGKHPKLSWAGWDVLHAPKGLQPTDLKLDHIKLRLCLSDIALTMELLKTCPKKSKKFQCSSAYLKNMIERVASYRLGHYGGFCSHGAVIAGALLLGLTIRAAEAPTAMINIPAKWVMSFERKEKKARAPIVTKY